MIHIYNLDDDSQEFKIGDRYSERSYEGKGGKKVAGKKDNEYYLIKMPSNLSKRNKADEEIEIPFNFAPLNEYIGSHIYKIIGLDVHETFLGYRENKIAVACKDFRKDGVVLQHFGGIKVSFLGKDENDINTNGNGSHLSSILNVIRNANIFKEIKEDTELHFWKMFVVDYLIGNIDRNSGNWGILNNEITKEKRLTPVFDNGNCLTNLLSDRQIDMLLKNNSLDYKLNKQRSFFYNDNNEPLNMYNVINEAKEEKLKKAIIEIYPKINLQKINDMIDEIPNTIISNIRAKYYKELLNGRTKNYLEPIYKRLTKNSNNNVLSPEQIKQLKFAESQTEEKGEKPPKPKQ